MRNHLKFLLYFFCLLLFNDSVKAQNNACALLIGSPFPDILKLEKNPLLAGETLKYDNLSVPVKKDLDSMRNLLLRSGFTINEISIIPDGNIRKEDLRKKIQILTQSLKDSATFVLYFTGHGQQVIDLGTDEDDNLDETLVLKADLWIDDDMQVLLKSDLKRFKNIFIFDACHSGTTFKLMMEKTNLDRLKENSIVNLIDDWVESTSPTNNSSCQWFLSDPNELSYSLVYIGAAGDNQSAKADNNGSWLTQKISLISKKTFFAEFTYEDLHCLLSAMANQEDKSFFPVYAEIGKINSSQQPLKPLK